VNVVSLRPDRTLLVVVAVMAIGALPLALSAAWFAPALLVPVVVGVWVVRARVVADDRELEICNGLRVNRVAWADVTGIRVPERGPVELLREGVKPLPLTAVTRRQLPSLLAVSKPR
jgi:hypothetical protein